MRGGGGDEVGLLFLGIACVLLLAVVAVAIFFYLTLQRCLSNIQPRNRDMEPGMVWLNLVPCLHFVWIFLTINWIGSSLRKEWASRRWPAEGENFGVTMGMAFAVCSILSSIPYVGFLASIPALICWIIYWVQIAGYNSTLQANPYRGRGGLDDDFDDDFEERKPRRRRRDYEDDRSRDDRYPDERIEDRPRRRNRDNLDDPDDRIRAR